MGLLYGSCGTEIVFMFVRDDGLVLKDEAAVRHLNECANWSGWQEVAPASGVSSFPEILSQLTSINKFDNVQAAKTVSYCLLIFILGFVVGAIIRNLRRL